MPDSAPDPFPQAEAPGVPAVPEPPRGETIASRRGFDGAHLHLRVDTVRLPSGTVRPREVLEHPGAVAIVGVTPEREVLLIRQWHHPIGRSLLGLPAGTREPGEAQEATARRELREETGFEAGGLRLLADYFTSPGWTDERMTVWLATDCRQVGDVANPDELIRVARVPLAAVPDLVAPGPRQLADGKTLVGLLLLLRDG